jgi:DNA-binding response OmpR family regulator
VRPATRESAGGASRRPTSVLWIDDDPLILGVCQKVLSESGYRVLTAADGAAGIEIARRERPDVILLDVIMAAMHGFEVCQRLRAEPGLRATPIILLTALEDAGVTSMGAKVGATLTLRKPYDIREIVDVIEAALRRASG